jgi:hypothetical protein
LESAGLSVAETVFELAPPVSEASKYRNLSYIVISRELVPLSELPIGNFRQKALVRVMAVGHIAN